MKKHDIYISYNRAINQPLVVKIYESLTQKGYNVYLGLRQRELCEFDDKEKMVIDNATDILVLLDGLSFKDLFEDLDYSIEHRIYSQIGSPFNREYFIREIMYALGNRSANIIPVLIDGYDWYNLPDELNQLILLKAVNYDSNKGFDNLQFLKSEPKNHNSMSFAQICKLYDNGEGIKTDDIDVLNYIGHLYEDGQSVDKDLDKAMDFIRKSAELGDSYAQQVVGLYYWRIKRDFDNAIVWFSKSAEQGNCDSIWHLAMCYKLNSSDEKNMTEYQSLLRKGAEAGSIMAQRELANSFQYGYGVEVDYKKAFYWYLKAAENGDSVSYRELGFCYEFGTGTEKNLNKAVDCLKKFTVFIYKYPESYFYVGDCLCKKGDYTNGFKYLEKASHYEPAHARLALCYEQGLGVEKDTDKAISIWTEIVNHYIGSDEDVDEEDNEVEDDFVLTDGCAPYHLARCYENGIGVEKDIAKAIKLYTLALKYEEDEYDYPEERFATLSREALTRLGVESSTI